MVKVNVNDKILDVKKKIKEQNPTEFPDPED
jgi:hypothetical protein